MRILEPLQEISLRLEPRTRRVLIFGSATGMTFSAGSTVSMMHAGGYLEAALGAAMLAVFTLGSAMAWTGLAAARQQQHQ